MRRFSQFLAYLVGSACVLAGASAHAGVSNEDDSLVWWSWFQGLLGFLGALPTTMQNWANNEQLRLPGYRDRVAHIALNSTEGGLNLKMSPEVCKRLSERGASALSRRLLAIRRDHRHQHDGRTERRRHRGKCTRRDRAQGF